MVDFPDFLRFAGVFGTPANCPATPPTATDEWVPDWSGEYPRVSGVHDDTGAYIETIETGLSYRDDNIWRIGFLLHLSDNGKPPNHVASPIGRQDKHRYLRSVFLPGTNQIFVKWEVDIYGFVTGSFFSGHDRNNPLIVRGIPSQMTGGPWFIKPVYLGSEKVSSAEWKQIAE